MIPSKPFACEMEARVIRSVRTGFWDADLEQHAASCPACSEAAFAARLLNGMRAADEAEARVPDAGLMWWKAQLLAKREAGEHATRPIRLIERFAYVLAAVCAIGVCVWQWSSLREWLVSHGNSGLHAGFDSFIAFAGYAARIVNPAIFNASDFFARSSLLMAAAGGLLLLSAIFAACFAQSEK
jgi:hypothetical protein